MARLTKSQRVLLEAVESRLVALTTKRSPCSVPPEVKERVRLYVESWILPDLREVLLSDLSGKQPDKEVVRQAEHTPKPEHWERVYGSQILDNNERGATNG